MGSRGNGIDSQRAGAITAMLARVDQLGGGNTAALIAELEVLATEVESGVEEAVWLNVGRLQSVADTLRGIATTLR